MLWNLWAKLSSKMRLKRWKQWQIFLGGHGWIERQTLTGLQSVIHGEPDWMCLQLVTPAWCSTSFFLPPFHSLLCSLNVEGHHSWSLVTWQHNTGFQSNSFFFFLLTAGISTVQVYVCSAWANMETAQHTRAVCFFFFVSFLEDVLKELFHINAANGGGVTTHQENARCFIFQEAQPFLYVGPGSKIWFHFWGQQTVKTSESKSKVGGVK